MIVPNKILIANYAAKLRDHISENGALLGIVDVSSKGIFDVDVYPVIVTTAKSMKQMPVVVQTELNGESEFRAISDSDLHWGSLLAIGETINDEGKTVRFDSIFDVYTSATVDESYKLKPLIVENPHSNQSRIVNTGTIDPYINFWAIWPMKYLKLSFLAPEAPSDVSTGSKKWHNLDKVIIAGMANTVEGCYSKGAELFPAIPTVVVTQKENSHVTAMAALGLVNSEPFRARFIDSNRLNAMAGGYITVTRVNIGECAIPETFSTVATDVDAKATKVYLAAEELRSITLSLKKLIESEFGENAWTTKMKNWWDFDFAKFVKALGVKLSLSQKQELIEFHTNFVTKAQAQTRVMNDIQSEISALVAKLY
jgi:hypothetical protein